MLRQVLSPVYKLLDLPAGYAAIQVINRPTTEAFRRMIAERVRIAASDAVLDLGCGIGNYRDCFGGDYTGVDINPDYIAECRQRYRGRFETMDATALDLPDASFDVVVTVATTHHLDDAQLGAMITEAMRVLKQGGTLYVIDAVLPDSALSLFKTTWFRMDRGRHPRKRAHLESVIGQDGADVVSSVEPGLMHDAFCAIRRKAS